MPSIADVADRKKLERRLARLTPDSSARWGRMNVRQMLDHVATAMERAMADEPLFDRDARVSAFVKYVALGTPLPWPKGMETPASPADTQVPASEFEQARQRVLDALIALADWQPTGITPPHSVFGRLSTEEWHVWAYKHAHHHLKQFGV